MRQNYKLPFFHPNHRQRNIILQLSIHYHGPMRSLSSGCFFVLPRIGRIGQIVSYGEKKRSKSLLLSLGLRPYSLMCMLSHVSELPCLNLPIRLVCPMADGKASKQNSCPWQYKMSLRRRLRTVTADLRGACPHRTVAAHSAPLPGRQYHE